jgi:hypothetical protein
MVLLNKEIPKYYVLVSGHLPVSGIGGRPSGHLCILLSVPVQAAEVRKINDGNTPNMITAFALGCSLRNLVYLSFNDFLSIHILYILYRT